MTDTDESEASTPSTFAPVSMRTFCFATSRAQALAISGSSSGRIWSSASSSTTSVPSRPSAEAISVPEAPAPITHRRLGCSFSSHMPAVSRIRLPNWRSRIGLATEPQARITRSVWISVPSNWPPIFTLPSSVTEPKPSIRSISFFLKSPATPPVSVLITLSRCLTAPPYSTEAPSTLIPNEPACCTSVNTSATRRIALAGMQASLRQRPPVLPFSTTAVLRPSWAARIAAT